jgi:hypothetical protein
MALRKPSRLTPKRLAAQRANAEKSTGPRTPAGKENTKLNALKHGCRARDASDRNVMLALGEDPEEFDRIYRSLLASLGPGDVLWAKQVEDLAKLYWRRARLERARAGMVQRELAYWKFAEERRQQEVKRAAFAPDERLILDVSVPQPEDSAAGLKQILAYLEMLREQVKERDFCPRQRVVLEQLYGEKRSWRTALLGDLLRRFADTSDNYSTPPGESEYGRLVALLEEEIGSVREESALLQREEKETSLAERDACLAPEGKQWGLLLRQENALDRAIDRKVRILVGLRDRWGNGGTTAQAPQAEEEARAHELDESDEFVPSPAAKGNNAE